jgi:hypothetical protein
MHFVYLFFLVLVSFNVIIANNYPMSKSEAQMLEMGSVLASSPTIKIKKSSNSSKINSIKEPSLEKKTQTLWIASIQELSDFPIIFIDDDSRTIFTDWLAVSKHEKSKIVLTIKPIGINEESLHVKIFTQKLQNSFSHLDSKKSRELEDKILLRAIKLSSYK